jgi:putative hydrolase of the HAD superfamily
MAEDYLRICPLKPHLMPNAIKTLDYLHQKYTLHIITNGFEEVQHIKMSTTGLDKYFQCIITSEAAKYKKPHPSIFDYALAKAQTSSSQSLMIGDSLESDVLGAQAIGMKQVYFNPKKLAHSENPTHEITDLVALMDIL